MRSLTLSARESSTLATAPSTSTVSGHDGACTKKLGVYTSTATRTAVPTMAGSFGVVSDARMTGLASCAAADVENTAKTAHVASTADRENRVNPANGANLANPANLANLPVNNFTAVL